MNLSWRALAMGIVCAFPFVAGAQIPYDGQPSATGPDATAGIEVGGTLTVDLVTVQSPLPGIPLRYGNVVSGSEQVELDGKILVRGTDYQIDLQAGVIYLMREQRPGMVLRVSYRHKPGEASASGTSGVMPMTRFDLLPNQGLRMMMGFGMAERFGSGGVTSSNVFGWNNNFSFAGGGMRGVLMFSERQQVDARSDFEYQERPVDRDTGRSRAIIQDIEADVLGGKMQVGYRDISRNFAAFNALSSSGIDAKLVDQMRKERGLERMSFSLTDVNVGGMKFSNSFRTVSEDDASIDWRSFGFNGGGLQFNWSSRTVDSNFRRFKDLAEEDRQQLQREAGMARENWSATFSQNVGKLNYSVSRIEDQNSRAIERREFGLDTGRIKFLHGSQDVEHGFSRIGSLTDAERNQFGRELGMNRQWMALEAAITGGAPLKFNQMVLNSSGGSFRSQDASVGGSGWSLQHISRSADTGFNSFNALSDQERNEHINAIGRMYDPEGVKFRPEEVGWFFRSSGLSRSLTRVKVEPFRGWSAGFDALRLEGQVDNAKVDTFDVRGPGLQFKLRQQNLGRRFSELMSLMEFERQRLGTISGLDRRDIQLDMKVGATGALSYAKMDADSPEGGASRDSLAFKNNQIDVRIVNREVDSGFNAVNRLVDSERELLTSLRGFRRRDIIANWQISPQLKLEALLFDAANAELEEKATARNYRLDWSPNRGTQVGIVRVDERSDDPLQVLFSRVIDRFSLAQDFGRYGKFRFQRESVDFEGVRARDAGWTTEFMAYEGNLDARTRVTTEQTRRNFDNGDHENISANTIATQITPKSGVAVTDVRVDRTGTERDERRRNYGFWIELPNGMKVSYGYQRHLTGADTGTMNAKMEVTPGKIGDLDLQQATYVENRWDQDDRTQSTSQVRLATARPFNFGFLSDLKFHAGFDSAADRSKWQRENKNFGFSGRLGTTSFAYDYVGVITPTGYRGIDRAFSLKTDQDEKHPLRANLFYKVRTLPWGDQLMIRNFNIVAQPTRGMLITHELLTNPEVAKGDAILGSVTQARQVNRWKVDFKTSADTTIGGAWEQISDERNPLARTGGLNVVLFQRSGSPLHLFYGLEQSGFDANRRTAHRYHLKFDQRPGPNQTFSFFLGNVSYQHSIIEGKARSNWTIRLDYQVRF